MDNNQNNDELSSLYSKPVVNDSMGKSIDDLQLNNQNVDQAVNTDTVQELAVASSNVIESNNVSIDNQNSNVIGNETTGFTDNSNVEINNELQQSNNGPATVSFVGNDFANNNMQDNLVNNNGESSSAYSDEDYLKQFIGNNSYKIMNKKFNFSAFFFGYAYFFYRKHFVFGIISILQYYIIPNVLSLFDLEIIPMLICSLIVSILLAFLFNKSYVNRAKKEVSYAKTHYTDYAIDNYLYKKGGTSGGLAFLGIVLFSVPQLLGISSLASINQWIVPYDGSIYYDSVVLSDAVDITIPEEFVRQKDSIFNEETYYSYIYKLDECKFYYDCEYCSLELFTIQEDKSAKSYSKRASKYYGSKLSKIKKNGIEWYKFGYDYDDFGSEFNYVTESNSKIYSIKFYDVTKNNSCQKYFDNILDSFKFKK